MKSSEDDRVDGELTAKSNDVLDSFDQALFINDLRLRLVIGALVMFVKPCVAAAFSGPEFVSLDPLVWEALTTGFVSG